MIGHGATVPEIVPIDTPGRRIFDVSLVWLVFPRATASRTMRASCGQFCRSGFCSAPSFNHGVPGSIPGGPISRPMWKSFIKSRIPGPMWFALQQLTLEIRIARLHRDGVRNAARLAGRETALRLNLASGRVPRRVGSTSICSGPLPICGSTCDARCRFENAPRAISTSNTFSNISICRT